MLSQVIAENISAIKTYVCPFFYYYFLFFAAVGRFCSRVIEEEPRNLDIGIGMKPYKQIVARFGYLLEKKF